MQIFVFVIENIALKSKCPVPTSVLLRRHAMLLVCDERKPDSG